jgi:DNA polymerase III subunit delta'
MEQILFPGVIGQLDVQRRLVGMVQQNRLSHAIMLLGPEGSGTLPLAVGFGQYVVSHPQQKREPVMVADLFGGMSALPVEEEDAPKDVFSGFDQKALGFVHPDLHFSYPVIKRNPEKDSPPVSADWAAEWRDFLKTNPYGNLFDWLQFIKAENRQGNITSRECMEIIHKLSLKPYESRYKVLVMWMPEMLGNEGNKLLKLIEEPPPDTLFIFVAEKEERILPTIISRCQIIRVPPLTTNDITRALMEKLDMEEAKAQQIALVSDGNFREAVELLQHHEDDWNGLLRDWLNATMLRVPAGGNPYAQVNKVVADLSGLGREKQKQLLLYFLQLIEQSLRLRLVGGDYLHLPPQEAEFAQRLNKVAGPSMLAALAEILEDASYFIERNANAKLLFHSLCLKMRAILTEKKRIGILP